LDILEKLKPAISQDNANFVFTKTNIGSYNNTIAILANFKTDFECSIPAEELIQILKKIKEKEINITQDDKNLLISSKKTKAKLSVDLVDDSKEVLNALKIKKAKKQLRDVPEDLQEALKICMFSAGQDKNDLLLSSVFIKDNEVISSDDQRISKFELSEKVSTPFLLPVFNIKELIKFKLKKYYVGTNWIYFLTEDDFMICSKVINEEYFNIGDQFEFEGKKIELPDELKEALNTALILADGDSKEDKSVIIVMKKKKLVCKGENDLGFVQKEISCDYKGKEIKICINPYFLLEILDKTNVMKVSDDRILFEIDNFSHVMAIYND